MKAEQRAKLKTFWEQRLEQWRQSGLSQVDWDGFDIRPPHPFPALNYTSMT